MKEKALYFAWLIALIGFCGSIFYGEILGHPPCPLCWYQRMALFPLVVLLGIAVYRGENQIVPYVFPIVIFGGLTALFQILRPMISFLQTVKVCGVGSSCSSGALTLWGVALFPLLSALGFFCIALLLLIARKRST